jgi:hypothetical protein
VEEAVDVAVDFCGAAEEIFSGFGVAEVVPRANDEGSVTI